MGCLFLDSQGNYKELEDLTDPELYRVLEHVFFECPESELLSIFKKGDTNANQT